MCMSRSTSRVNRLMRADRFPHSPLEGDLADALCSKATVKGRINSTAVLYYEDLTLNCYQIALIWMYVNNICESEKDPYHHRGTREMNQQETENLRERSPTKRGMANAVLIDHTYYDYSNHDISAVKKLLAGADVASGAESSVGGPELNEVADSQIIKKRGTAQVRTKKGRVTFPSKLHSILSNANYCDIIRWMPHGRSWKIFDKDRLASVVCKESFNHNSFDSFNRSVNGWGFKRLMKEGPDCKSYYSELFLRGRPELARLLTRLVNPGKRIPDPKGEPNFYEISKKYPLPLDPITEHAVSCNLNRNQESHQKPASLQQPRKYEETIRAHPSLYSPSHWPTWEYHRRHHENHIPHIAEYGYPQVSTHLARNHSACSGHHYHPPHYDLSMQNVGVAHWPKHPYHNYNPPSQYPYTRQQITDQINNLSVTIGNGQGRDQNTSTEGWYNDRLGSHTASFRGDVAHPPRQHVQGAVCYSGDQDEKPSGEWLDHRFEIYSTDNRGDRDFNDIQCLPRKKSKAFMDCSTNPFVTSFSAAPQGPSDSLAMSFAAALEHNGGTPGMLTHFFSDGLSKIDEDEKKEPTVMSGVEALDEKKKTTKSLPTPDVDEREPPTLRAGIVAYNPVIPSQLSHNALTVERSESLFEPWRYFVEGIHDTSYDKISDAINNIDEKDTAEVIQEDKIQDFGESAQKIVKKQ